MKGHGSLFAILLSLLLLSPGSSLADSLSVLDHLFAQAPLTVQGTSASPELPGLQGVDEDRVALPGNRFEIPVTSNTRVCVEYQFLDIRLEQALTDQGTPPKRMGFLMSTGIESPMEMRMLELGVTQNLSLAQNHELFFCLGGRALLLDAEGGDTSPVSDRVFPERVNDFLPLPSVGIGFRLLPLPSLGIYGTAKGLTAGSSRTVLDAEAGLVVHIAKGVTLSGGYRRLQINAGSTTIGDEIDFVGGFAAVEIPF